MNSNKKIPNLNEDAIRHIVVEQKKLKIERKSSALVFLKESGFKDTTGGLSNGSHFIGENNLEFETDKELDNFRDRINKERLAEIERKKQAEILAAQQAKAEAERKTAEVARKKLEAENFRKLEIERREKERVQNELRLKQEAEQQARVKAEAKEELLNKAIELLKKCSAFIDVIRFELGEDVDEIDLEQQVNKFLEKFNKK